MKKKGLMNGLIKAGILAATLGGTIYLLRDKIEECPNCRESLDKAKDAVKKFTSGKKDDLNYTEDFEDDFDDVDELDEILESPADREYVSIKLSEEMNNEADEDGVSGSVVSEESSDFDIETSEEDTASDIEASEEDAISDFEASTEEK